MTLQPGLQTLAILMLPNISQNTENEMGNITWEIFSFKNYAENEVRRLVPDLFLFF